MKYLRSEALLKLVKLLRSKSFLKFSQASAPLSCGVPRWYFNGGRTESKQISLGDIKVKCLTFPFGTDDDDITAVDVRAWAH